MKSSYIILYVVIIISSIININEFKSLLWFLLILPLYLYLYLFFSSTIKGDKKEYIAKLIMLSGLIASFQTIYYLIITTPEILKNQIFHGLSYTLSWANPNIGAIFLNLTIGFTFYLIVLKPRMHLYKIFALLQIFALILTVSRGGILILALSLVSYVIYIYLKRPSNLYFYFNTCLVIIILIIFSFLFYEYIIILFEHFINTLTATDPTSGRIELMKEAYDIFKESPLIGKGLFYRVDQFETIKNGVIITHYAFYSYHSLLAQIIANAGLLGLLALIYNYKHLYQILLSSKDVFNHFCLIIFTLCFIYSFFDNVFLEPHYMIINFLAIGVIESTINPLK